MAKALKAEGIDTIFTLCGGHIIDIYDGCIDEGIKVVDVRHEQVAAHAADGYARVTGRPGCAVVTAGPGTTDAVTGVANALRAEGIDAIFTLCGGHIIDIYDGCIDEGIQVIDVRHEPVSYTHLTLPTTPYV